MDSEKKLPTSFGPLGAHTSAAGGVHNALLEGSAIGASTIQLFTANQKTWATKPIDEAEVALWDDALEKTGISQVMSHSSYLINLGSPRSEVHVKSLSAFEKEIKRCNQLKLSYLNFHPGAALDSPEETCLDKIVSSLLVMRPLMENSSLRLLLELTAGQGSVVGCTFEQLAYIIDRTKDKLPIGVCIDTCHCFAAGYDLRTRAAVENTLEQFHAIVGKEHLYALHLNDSLYPLGCRKDRHAHIGEGEIGLAGFEALMNHPMTRPLPKYLETPGGPDQWKIEIPLMKKMVACTCT